MGMPSVGHQDEAGKKKKNTLPDLEAVKQLHFTVIEVNTENR